MDEAMEIREGLRHGWEALILPALESALDRVASGGQVVRIPRIEIRFRVSPGRGWREDVEGRIRDQMGICVEAAMLEAKGRGASGDDVPPVEDAVDALVHYLTTGVMRWDAADADSDVAFTALRTACQVHLAIVCRRLRQGLASMPVCHRLLQLVMDAEGAAPSATSSLVTDIHPAWRRLAARVLEALLGPAGAPWGPAAQLGRAAQFLSAAIRQRSDPQVPDVTAWLLGMGISESWSGWDALGTGMRPTSPGSKVASRAHIPAAEEGSEEVTPGPGLGDRPDDGTVLLPRGIRHANSDGVPTTAPGDGRMPASQGPGAETAGALGAASQEGFPLVVAGAGLVILHPFLPRFFGVVGLRRPDDKGLKDAARAAALLHYLATGRTRVFEFEASLAKVLLGMGPTSPMCLAEGLLSEADLGECHALLRAVLSHWKSLKGTSAEGFREAFVNRAGLLRATGSGWHLRVERTGFDALLDRLPWGIGLVKLPWMSQPLHCEW